MPVTQTDPGPDGVRGNADDPGTSFTLLRWLPGSTAGRSNASPASAIRGRSDLQQRRRRDVEASVQPLAADGVPTRRPSATCRSSTPTSRRRSPGVRRVGNGVEARRSIEQRINVADKAGNTPGKLSGVYRGPFGIGTSANLKRAAVNP